MSEPIDVGNEFIATARRHLVLEYLPKLSACVEQLSEENFWWRPSEMENSVGNLLLHLSGNLRQWIISGIGGAADIRVRQEEFDARGGRSKEEVMRLFTATVEEVDRILKEFDVRRLTEVRHFQKWDYSCLYAISHVVEHVAQHMGQIIFITKLRNTTDLKFFIL